MFKVKKDNVFEDKVKYFRVPISIKEVEEEEEGDGMEDTGFWREAKSWLDFAKLFTFSTIEAIGSISLRD